MNLNKTLDSFVIIKNSNEKIVNENDNNIIKRKETSPEKKTEKKSKKINSNNNNSTIEINSKEEQQKNSSKEQKNNSSKEKNNNNSSNNNTNSSKENNIINNYPNLKFYPTYTSFISCLSSWQEPLSNFISPPSNKTMLFIYNFIKNEYETKTIFPPKNQIFSAFQQTPFSSLKVVIIGQDPYPNPNDAMGLSFSVNKSQAIPPSLMNIYKCLENDKKLNFKKPSHGDLTFWAKQGVFFIKFYIDC